MASPALARVSDQPTAGLAGPSHLGGGTRCSSVTSVRLARRLPSCGGQSPSTETTAVARQAASAAVMSEGVRLARSCGNSSSDAGGKPMFHVSKIRRARAAFVEETRPLRRATRQRALSNAGVSKGTGPNPVEPGVEDWQRSGQLRLADVDVSVDDMRSAAQGGRANARGVADSKLQPEASKQLVLEHLPEHAAGHDVPLAPSRRQEATETDVRRLPLRILGQDERQVRAMNGGGSGRRRRWRRRIPPPAAETVGGRPGHRVGIDVADDHQGAIGWAPDPIQPGVELIGRQLAGRLPGHPERVNVVSPERRRKCPVGALRRGADPQRRRLEPTSERLARPTHRHASGLVGEELEGVPRSGANIDSASR